MKVLFLCGVFGKEMEQDLIRAAKKPLEYSANVFQEKMISGFEKCGTDIEIVSAPLVGSFPNASRILKFDAEKYHITAISMFPSIIYGVSEIFPVPECSRKKSRLLLVRKIPGN